MKTTNWTRMIMTDRKIVEALLSGKSQRDVCREVRVGNRRVAKLEKLAREAGYLDGSRPLPPFPEALFPRAQRAPVPQSDPDAALMSKKDWIVERLAAGWHKVTLFEELPVRVSRSSFYRFLDRHGLGVDAKPERAVPEIVHRPGEALLLDWGHLCTITDPDTGKRRKVWAFVGVLGYSRLLTVRLVWTNSVDVTMQAIEDMIVELGGVPGRVTSDNPKCFALEADRFQPLLNPAFEMLASHMGFVIECLPPRDPEKKGKVERPMPFVRRLFEAHGEWKGIEEAEEYLRAKVAIANERKHGTTGDRPKDRFEREEKTALGALPAVAFERQEIGESTVREDNHVRFKNKYYSVGEGYRGKDALILGNSRTVRIHIDGVLVAVHPRITDKAMSKSTKDEHKKTWERTLTDNAHYVEKANAIGPNVKVLVECVLASQHGFVETRMVWGLFHLATIYSRKDVDDACGIALETHGHTYRDVKRILESTCTPTKSEDKNHEHAFTRPMNDYTNFIAEKRNKNERNNTAGAASIASPLNRCAGSAFPAGRVEEEREHGLGRPSPRT